MFTPHWVNTNNTDAQQNTKSRQKWWLLAPPSRWHLSVVLAVRQSEVNKKRETARGNVTCCSLDFGQNKRFVFGVNRWESRIQNIKMSIILYSSTEWQRFVKKKWCNGVSLSSSLKKRFDGWGLIKRFCNKLRCLYLKRKKIDRKSVV